MKRPTLCLARTCLGWRIAFVLGFACFIVCVDAALAQSQSSPSSGAADNAAVAPAPDKAVPEMTSHDEATTFKVNVRLVLVRVVVRDAEGHAVANLRKQDFQLFDNRKPQVISQFSMEQPGSQVAKEQKTTEIAGGDNTTTPMPNVPERFIAYLFDDIHLQMQDLLPVRTAADRRLSAMQPTDRAAIFTTSGQNSVEFTDDRAKLQQGLLGLQPHPIAASEVQECPYMSYYMADLIANKNDPQAFANATSDALQCEYQNNSKMLAAAQGLAQSSAQRALSLGDSETHLTLALLRDVMRRMAAVPGQRTIVLVSPGFITPRAEQELTDVIDQALRTNIVVSSVDARGLYVPPQFANVGQQNVPNVVTSPQETLYQSSEAAANDDVLSTVANSTGGVFFHNSNDLDAGLKQAGETPAYYYVLGFSPQNLKYDGRFHSLSVKLTKPAKYTIQSRNGYYAPRQAPNPEEEARQEIQEAVFSQEEMRDLPVDLHTQFFKTTDVDAKLSVLVHVDVKRLHFQKLEGRNKNDLTIVAVLFDRNGSFVQGNEKVLEMRWKDETLEHKLDRGLTLRSSFEVKPGSYLVRLVVRDNEGLLSAENGAIEIP